MPLVRKATQVLMVNLEMMAILDHMVPQEDQEDVSIDQARQVHLVKMETLEKMYQNHKTNCQNIFNYFLLQGYYGPPGYPGSSGYKGEKVSHNTIRGSHMYVCAINLYRENAANMHHMVTRYVHLI